MRCYLCASRNSSIPNAVTVKCSTGSVACNEQPTTTLTHTLFSPRSADFALLGELCSTVHIVTWVGIAQSGACGTDNPKQGTDKGSPIPDWIRHYYVHPTSILGMTKNWSSWVTTYRLGTRSKYKIHLKVQWRYRYMPHGKNLANLVLTKTLLPYLFPRSMIFNIVLWLWKFQKCFLLSIFQSKAFSIHWATRQLQTSSLVM